MFARQAVELAMLGGTMLERLLVRNFRCYEEAVLPLHPAMNLLVGRNAQGKTSLLEAACVLMRLQSPRTSSRYDLIRFDTPSCLVEGLWAGTRLRFAQSAKTRRLAVNEAVCGKSGDYLQHTALVVWMDHADMNLLRGGAEHRRRYLDFVAAQIYPQYLDALRQYERVLRSRNYLLKRDAVIPWRQVDAYTLLLAEHGATIRACRAALLAALQEPVAQAQRQLSSGAEVALAAYQPGYDGDDLATALLAMREEESRTRSTSLGIHRDDVLLTINGRPAGAFASEGQQRTLGLALKLAQAQVLQQHRGRAPLLLIDDVFGELDPERRVALLGALPAESQKLITTTFLDWAGEWMGERAVWEVSDAKIK